MKNNEVIKKSALDNALSKLRNWAKGLFQTTSDADYESASLSILGYVAPKINNVENTLVGDVFTQRIGRVDLGTLNWTYSSAGLYFLAQDLFPSSSTSWGITNAPNVYCTKYLNDATWNQIASNIKDKRISSYSHQARISDSSYTDVTAFKNAVSGTYLYYELATPITYSVLNNSKEGLATEEELGINVWDEEWEKCYWDVETGAKVTSLNFIGSKDFISVIPTKTYYLCAPQGSFVVLFYNKSKTIISYISQQVKAVFSTPANCYYMTFYVGSSYSPDHVYNNDICINLSNPLYNGNYYPSVGIRRDIAKVVEEGTGYLKFGNGTLVQFGSVNVTTTSSTPTGSFPYRGVSWVNFKLPFIATPFVFTNIEEDSAYWNSTANYSNANTTNIYIAGDGNNATKQVSWVAIGRWK